jgi:hypothetical protein
MPQTKKNADQPRFSMQEDGLAEDKRRQAASSRCHNRIAFLALTDNYCGVLVGTIGLEPTTPTMSR